jgi:drug/metabolite transporter (DMT)-like permease
MSEANALKEQKLIKGVLVTLLSGFCYAVYSLMAKWTQQQGVNFYQVSFFTFFISWLGLAPYLLCKQWHHLKTKQLHWLFLRSIFGLSIVYFFVVSLQTIPLVDAVMLNNSAPLFIPFIAYFILKIPINHKLWGAIALGIIGLILILRPDQQLFNKGGIWGLMSGVAMAFSWVTIRKLTYTEPTTRIVFYFLTISTLITAIPLIWTWQPLPSSAWLDLLLVGAAYLITSITFTLAAKWISITLVSMLYYSVVVFSVFLNWFFFQQLPGLITFFGILLVTGGGMISLWIEGRKIK